MLYDNRGSYQRGTLNVAINNNTVSFMSSQTITRNDEFPAETRRSTIQKKSISTSPIFMPRYDIIGHPSLRIYKFKLPTNLLHLLDYIVKSCNSHALCLQRGWATYLYSLTKQDIAVRDVGGLYEVCMHLSFLKVCCIYRSGLTDQPYRIHSLRLPDRLWDTSRKQSRVFTVFILLESIGISLTFWSIHVKMDQATQAFSYIMINVIWRPTLCFQGRVITLEEGKPFIIIMYTWIVDICIHIKLHLSTYFPDANTTSKLEFGEFLIHPGNLVHAGIDITRGTRYLMVIFTHTETR